MAVVKLAVGEEGPERPNPLPVGGMQQRKQVEDWEWPQPWFYQGSNKLPSKWLFMSELEMAYHLVMALSGFPRKIRSCKLGAWVGPLVKRLILYLGSGS